MLVFVRRLTSAKEENYLYLVGNTTWDVGKILQLYSNNINRSDFLLKLAQGM